jgi:Phage tail tube, TTP, lambda-like
MTIGTVKTQGTELYVIDASVTASEEELYKIACPTGISGLGGARDQIEDTCLDTTDEKTYVAGLGNPGQVSVPFNLIPRNGSHQFLFAWKEAGVNMKWLVCLSESSTQPTVDTDGEFVKPTDRTTIAFTAYVSDVNIDMATNEIVRGTLTLQRSGAVNFVGYTPA